MDDFEINYENIRIGHMRSALQRALPKVRAQKLEKTARNAAEILRSALRPRTTFEK